MIVFDGKKFSHKRAVKLKLLARQWQQKNKKKPRIALILIGRNKENELFVKQKVRLAKKLGVETEIISFLPKKPFFLSAKRKERIIAEIAREVEEIGQGMGFDGVVVQLPLPKFLKSGQEKIMNSIPVSKDIDGLTEKSTFLPAVIKAVWLIINTYELFSPKMTVAVVGAKGGVGSRLVALFKKSKARKILEIDLDNKKDLVHLNKADLVVSCVGKRNLIRGEMIKKGAVVLDLGTMVVEKGNVAGDLKLEEVIKRAAFVSPVPGGIGPVTVVSLFENLLTS